MTKKTIIFILLVTIAGNSIHQLIQNKLDLPSKLQGSKPYELPSRVEEERPSLRLKSIVKFKGKMTSFDGQVVDVTDGHFMATCSKEGLAGLYTNYWCFFKVIFQVYDFNAKKLIDKWQVIDDYVLKGSENDENDLRFARFDTLQEAIDGSSKGEITNEVDIWNFKLWYSRPPQNNLSADADDYDYKGPKKISLRSIEDMPKDRRDKIIAELKAITDIKELTMDTFYDYENLFVDWDLIKFSIITAVLFAGACFIDRYFRGKKKYDYAQVL